jgi:ribonuclease H / adenosylcobalamin/alpha-ribazole phosphatase
MSRRLWLVRHASTDWTGRRWSGRSDLPLSEAGLGEASDLAERLRHLLPDSALVLSSPAKRARQTAQAIARARWNGGGRRHVRVIAALAEVDFGEVDGLAWQDIERDMPALAREIFAGGRIDWPGGESADEIDVRIRAIEVEIERAERPLVVVSHGAVLGVLAGRLTASAVLARTMLGPATALSLSRHGRTWRVSSSRP